MNVRFVITLHLGEVFWKREHRVMQVAWQRTSQMKKEDARPQEERDKYYSLAEHPQRLLVPG
jgi:hypothetical protein